MWMAPPQSDMQFWIVQLVIVGDPFMMWMAPNSAFSKVQLVTVVVPPTKT